MNLFIRGYVAFALSNVIIIQKDARFTQSNNLETNSVFSKQCNVSPTDYFSTNFPENVVKNYQDTELNKLKKNYIHAAIYT